MLEHFKSGDSIEPLVRLRFKSTNKQVFAKRIIPSKIEAAIPHQPHEKPVATAEIEKPPVGIQAQRDYRMRDTRKEKIATD